MGGTSRVRSQDRSVVSVMEPPPSCRPTGMSTRAIVAVSERLAELPTPDAEPTGFLGRLFRIRPRPKFRGVYLHNGGGPSDVGPLLFHMVNARHRGDVAAAAKELVFDNPAGWSSLHFFSDEDRARGWNGTKLTLEQHQGYCDRDEEAPGPATYQGDPQRDLGFRAPPIGANTDKMGADFVYVLSRPGLVVYLVGEDGVALEEVARLAWSEAPDWAAADAAVDAAFGSDGSDDEDDE